MEKCLICSDKIYREELCHKHFWMNEKEMPEPEDDCEFDEPDAMEIYHREQETL